MQVDVDRRALTLGLVSSATLPLAVLQGCGGGEHNTSSASNVVVPTGGTWVPPTTLVNTSSVPNQFAANLSAKAAFAQVAQGAATAVWAYNGISPGPMIEVTEGDSVDISFSNQLSQSSSIHWHGLPVPASEDGNPMDTVAAGSARNYRYTLPLGCSGTYWFHPHPHQTTHQQVYMGLAGAFIVRAKNDPLAGIADRVMMVTCMRLDANNQMSPNTEMDFMNGREGDQLLINGIKQPKLAVAPGSVERWRVINATNANYLRLSLAGHDLIVVAYGGPLIETPQAVSEVLLAPGQRVEVLVKVSNVTGQSFQFRSLAYDRNAMMNTPVTRDLMTMSTSGTPVSPIAIPTTLYVTPQLPSPVRTQMLSLEEGMMGDSFRINGKTFDAARVDLITTLNDVEDWLITNRGTMDHPFHIHGTLFQLIDSSRGDTTPPLTYRAWIDTINIRPNETVRVRIQQTQLGKRMFHCHILEHEDQGMMGVLDVRA